MVIPSASDASSRTMSATSREPWPGSRERMNQAFSANRHALRNNRVPYASHRARTARRFSSETGWPPPLLLVTVTITHGTITHGTSSPRARSDSSATTSILPLNG